MCLTVKSGGLPFSIRANVFVIIKELVCFSAIVMSSYLRVFAYFFCEMCHSSSKVFSEKNLVRKAASLPFFPQYKPRLFTFNGVIILLLFLSNVLVLVLDGREHSVWSIVFCSK